MTKKELVEYLNNFDDDAEVLVLENGNHYEDNYSIEDVYQVTTRRCHCVENITLKAIRLDN